MKLHPKIPTNPYDDKELTRLVKKFKAVTDVNPEPFIEILENIIKDNFSDDELLDYSACATIKSIFLFNSDYTAHSQIFFYSVLKETLDYNLYHSIKDLKRLLKSIKL